MCARAKMLSDVWPGTADGRRYVRDLNGHEQPVNEYDKVNDLDCASSDLELTEFQNK